MIPSANHVNAAELARLTDWELLEALIRACEQHDGTRKASARVNALTDEADRRCPAEIAA